MSADGMPDEPILHQEDVIAWDLWQRTAEVHASTLGFLRHVDGAKRVVDRALAKSRLASVSWSGGKDSTVLAHLVTVELGARDVVLLSEKDDLDYPGEEEYVVAHAARWRAQLRIVRPDVSPAQWVIERAAEIHVGDDIHARSAGLSKACFYRVMEEADRDFEVSMLGLRAAESGRRKALLKRSGQLYQLKRGMWRAHPIGWWSGIDVLAYAASRGIELLHVYRCIGFMHSADPWDVRKSWWLPGAQTTRGQAVWLRRYYPSLYRKMLQWLPHASHLG